MSLTIQHRIELLIAERLSDHLVCNSEKFVLTATENKETLLEKLSLSGEYAQSYPRKFSISVIDNDTLHVTERTLWADMREHPVEYDADVSFVNFTPFDIADSGIVATITGGVVGDYWIVKGGKASNTLVDIVAHPVLDDEVVPRLSVYAAGNEVDRKVLDKDENELDIILRLAVSGDDFESGIAHEWLGDITDCLNRDRSLYDNTECLTTDFYFDSSFLIDASRESGKAIFQIQAKAKFRTSHTNSRKR
jgi:hypothetical protein